MILRIALFLMCVATGLAFGIASFYDPARFLSIVDMFVSILSMIVGVSLAVAAILGAAPSIKPDHGASVAETQRMERIIGFDDQLLYNGQFYSLILYFASIMLCVSFKWLAFEVKEYDLFMRSLSGVSGGLSLFLTLWSLRLPILLKAIVWQRRGF